MGYRQLQYFHNGLARRFRGFFGRMECASLQFPIYAVVVFLCSLGCRDFTFAAANESTVAVCTFVSSQFLHMDIHMRKRVHGALLLCNSWGPCVHFLQGDFRLHWRDLLGAGLCLIFKPQYLPFILQGLAFIWLADKLTLTSNGQMLLGAFFIILNIGILYFIQPLVDDLSFMMYAHFDLANAESTRDNIFLHEGDFYRQAPYGMFLSFFGPTLSEMIQKPTHLIAGMESLLIVFLMLFMVKRSLKRLCFLLGRLEPRYFFSIFLIITGICFIHYPFGIFNPGSAIRYRTNFIFLFILILSELYIHDTTKELQEDSFLRQQPA